MQRSELCETFEEKRPEDAAQTVDAKIEKSVSEWVSAGRAKMDGYDFTGAIKDFNRALEINPMDADAYLGRAKAYVETANIGAARADYGQAVLSGEGDLEVVADVMEFYLSDYRVSSPAAQALSDVLVQRYPNSSGANYLVAQSKLLPDLPAFIFAVNVSDEVLYEAVMYLRKAVELDGSAFMPRDDLKVVCSRKPYICTE